MRDDGVLCVFYECKIIRIQRMAFRADEAVNDGFERAMRYLVPREISGPEKKRSQNLVADIIDKCGSVVESYPSWHPLVSANDERRFPVTRPESRCGYHGLDHTIHFVNGFVSCPYDDGKKIISSVEELPYNSVATITAERLNGQLYHPSATPILVRCKWHKAMPVDGMIPKSLAVPLMLEEELPCWREAEVAETWEAMRPYFLGSPYGSRSSLFVNQETGQALKNVWKALIYTGMFGPIKVD
jgi:hypothetical protein